MSSSFGHSKRKPGAFRSRSAQNRDFSRHDDFLSDLSLAAPPNPIRERSFCRIGRFAFPRATMVSSKTQNMKTPTLSAHQFRKALGHFATRVTVVTVERAPGSVRGMTANSFTSVSLDPLLILICVEKRAAILPLLEKQKQFGVSVLKEGHEAISEYFSKGTPSAEAEQRLSIHYRWTPSGIPLLQDTLLHLSCTVVASHLPH